MSYAALRSRYVADTVATASPTTLLVMLYDRLVLDIERGEAALRAGNRHAATSQLCHAQEIVLELRSSLDMEAWDGAQGLAGLYVFLHSELVRVNVASDADGARVCRDLVAPLRDAWREAALNLATPPMAQTS